MRAQREAFRIDDWLQPLAAEFGVLAQQKGLALDRVPTSPAWVRQRRAVAAADAAEFSRQRRALHAHGPHPAGLSATRRSAVDRSLGYRAGHCRSRPCLDLRGIPAPGQRGGQGLGLGLAIADRLARLLGHPLDLALAARTRHACSRSKCRLHRRRWPAAAAAHSRAPRPPRSRVLVVDNEAAVRDAMQALLRGWDCEVHDRRRRRMARHRLHALQRRTCCCLTTTSTATRPVWLLRVACAT